MTHYLKFQNNLLNTQNNKIHFLIKYHFKKY